VSSNNRLRLQAIEGEKLRKDDNGSDFSIVPNV
jgi:hypothetical protein